MPALSSPQARSAHADVGFGDDVLFQKLVYVICNALLLGLAVYKIHSMRLLPTYESDWLHFMDMKVVSHLLLGVYSFHVRESSLFAHVSSLKKYRLCRLGEMPLT